MCDELDDDYNPDIYTLTHEDGKEETFELLYIMEYKGKNYFALVPYFEDEDDMLEDDGDLIILRGEMDGDQEMMVSIDDDHEYQEVGKLFIEKLEKIFEQDIYEDE